MSKWMIYGATGYTAGLIAELCHTKGMKPVLAGRNLAKIEAIAKKYGFEAVAFDLNDEAAVRKALQGCKVLLNCAGPFVDTYRPLVAACLAVGCHYLDITGEIEVFEALAKRSDEAKKAGVVLLPGVGFDVVPSDCLLKFVSEKLPEAESLELGIKTSSGVYAQGGRIFAATEGGLAISTDGGKKWVTRTTLNGLRSNYNTSVWADDQRILVASGAGGDAANVVSYDNGLTFQEINASILQQIVSTTPGVFSFGATWAKGNDIIYGGGDGIHIHLVKADGTVKDLHRTGLTPGANNTWVTGVYRANGRIIASTWGNGIVYSDDDGDTWSNVTRSSSSGMLANDTVWAVTVDGNNVYASTFEGLSVSRDNGTTFTEKYLSMKSVFATFASGATVYAATAPYSLFIGQNGPASLSAVPMTKGLLSPNVMSVYAKDLTVVAGTSYGLAVSIDGGKTFATRTREANQLGSNSIQALQVANGKIYAGTSEGISVSDMTATSFTTILPGPEMGFEANNISCLQVVGDLIAAGTRVGLAVSLDGGKTFNYRKTVHGLPDDRVRAVYYRNNTLYVGTMGGLAISTDVQNGFSSFQVYLAGSPVYGTYSDSVNVYATTSNGLYLSTDLKTWTLRNTTHGLGNNQSWSVISDDKFIYVATEGGLSISGDGGRTFVNEAGALGIASNQRGQLFIDKDTIYVGSLFGLFVSLPRATVP